MEAISDGVKTSLTDGGTDNGSDARSKNDIHLATLNEVEKKRLPRTTLTSAASFPVINEVSSDAMNI
jgi:hypothetical protein